VHDRPEVDVSRIAAARPSRRGLVMRALTEEVVATFHRLRATSEQLHGDGDSSAGRRGVLRELARVGPRTVPDMARSRPVSRQYMQVLVDGLAADGLVKLVHNPAHARSHLVQLTAAGRRMLAASDARESQAFEDIAAGFDAREVERVALLLRNLRESLARLHDETAGRRDAVAER
jgi:DNA-binding MarR family transcriptional regulator